MSTFAPSTREEILKAANEIIKGEREDSYGGPEDSFKLVAAFWTVYLSKAAPGVELQPHDVALMMDLLKTARLVAAPDHVDSWIDKAGYAACGAECAL